MKVKDLKPNVLVRLGPQTQHFPVGMWIINTTPTGENMPWLAIRGLTARGRLTNVPDGTFLYLGTRKDVNVSQKDFGWSNRYGLVQGKIVAIDPAAWKHLELVGD